MGQNRFVRCARRERVSPAGYAAVTQRPLLEGGWSPWLVESADQAVDLIAWSAANRSDIERQLLNRGTILFRGFAADESLFRRFVSHFIPNLLAYKEGATPRTALGGGVYTSTEFPSNQTIHLHNELSYVLDWPMRLAFFCLRPATSGGATPLADMRRVHSRLRPALAEAFARRGWSLVRNYGNGLGPDWQRAFGLQTIDELASYCQSAKIDLEILSPERIRTRQSRPAVRHHPLTGEALWFNHVAFWHPSSLPDQLRRGVGLQFRDEDLPFNTLWGDGEIIADDLVAEIRDAIEAETVAFPWQAGDLLLIDNMLVAHGRAPFTGERRVLASMGEPFSGFVATNDAARRS